MIYSNVFYMGDLEDVKPESSEIRTVLNYFSRFIENKNKKTQQISLHWIIMVFLFIYYDLLSSYNIIFKSNLKIDKYKEIISVPFRMPKKEDKTNSFLFCSSLPTLLPIQNFKCQFDHINQSFNSINF
jgi:hypothetical protein